MDRGYGGVGLRVLIDLGTTLGLCMFGIGCRNAGINGIMGRLSEVGLFGLTDRIYTWNILTHILRVTLAVCSFVWGHLIFIP